MIDRLYLVIGLSIVAAIIGGIVLGIGMIQLLELLAGG